MENGTETELDELRQETFLQLKSTCISLLSYPSINSTTAKSIHATLKNLLSTLESISNPTHSLTHSLTDYVLVPLLDVYRRQDSLYPPPDYLTETWLRCIQFLLTSGSWLQYMSEETYREVFILFTLIIVGTSRNTTSKVEVSEETKLIAIRCLAALISDNLKGSRWNGEHEQLTDKGEQHWRIRNFMKAESSWPAIGHLVSILLDVITQDRLLVLRVEAVEVLRALFKDSHAEPDFLASLLPGVSSALGKVVILDSSKENHRIMVAAINCLSDILVGVFSDDKNEALSENISRWEDLKGLAHESVQHREENSSNPVQRRSLTTPRSKSWLHNTLIHLQPLFIQIFRLRTHISIPFRHSILIFSSNILTYCSKTLKILTPILLETLVLYTSDEDISSYAINALEDIRSTHLDFRHTLVPTLKDQLATWMRGLPSYLLSPDEITKRSALNLVRGFVILLGPDSHSVIRNTLEKCAEGWLKGIQIEGEYEGVMEVFGEEHTTNMGAEGQLDELISGHEMRMGFSKPKLTYVTEESTFKALVELLRIFGRYANTEFVIGLFLDIIKGDGEDTERSGRLAECIFVINEVLIGNAELDKIQDNIQKDIIMPKLSKSAQILAKTVLCELISLNIIMDFDPFLSRQTKSLSLVPARSQSFLSSNSTSFQKTTTVQSIALILETISTTARILGFDFRIELIDVLYPILEQLASHSAKVSSAAMASLMIVTFSCGYDTSQHLILENVDYIIDSVSRRLTRLRAYPRAPRVLGATIRVGGGAVLSYLDDSIKEIFEALDDRHMEQGIAIELSDCLGSIIRVLNIEALLTSIRDVEEELDEIKDEPRDNGVSKEIRILMQKYEKCSVNFGAFDKIVEKDEDIEEGVKNMEEIGSYFLKQQEKKAQMTIEREPTDIDDKENNQISNKQTAEGIHANTPSKLTPTRNQQITIQILERTSYLLTAPSSLLRSRILNLIRKALPVLAPLPSELNPLIHKLWPSIVHRLADPEHFVVLNAITLINDLAEASGDFLTTRIGQDIWPKFKVLFVQLLSETPRVNISAHISINDSYISFTRTHRLQRALLQTTSLIIRQVPIRETQVFDVIETCYPYLDKARCHLELQQCAIDLFGTLMKVNPDAVWLVLNGLIKSFWHPPVDVGGIVEVFELPLYLKRGLDEEFEENVHAVFRNFGI